METTRNEHGNEATGVHSSRPGGYTQNDAEDGLSLEVDAPVEIDIETAIRVDVRVDERLRCPIHSDDGHSGCRDLIQKARVNGGDADKQI